MTNHSENRTFDFHLALPRFCEPLTSYRGCLVLVTTWHGCFMEEKYQPDVNACL